MLFFLNGYELQSFHRVEAAQNFRCGLMCLAEIAGRPKALNHHVKKLSSLIPPEPIIAQSDAQSESDQYIYIFVYSHIYTQIYLCKHFCR